jgi:hypothetical protein
MQGDGNLVLYQNGSALWASNTSGQNCSANQCYAAFQGDGSFVVYNGATPLWSSQTNGNYGAQLVLSGQAPYIEIVGSSQAILWDNSIPDPTPGPYSNELSSPPSSPPGACNITGNWADSTSLGSSWFLTQIGVNVVGTYHATIAPLNPSCGSITWHVTGTYSSGAGTFVATSPSSAFDQCGNPASSTINATVVFGSCTAGAAQETSIIPPWKNQFGQSGPGGTTASRCSR